MKHCLLTASIALLLTSAARADDDLTVRIIRMQAKLFYASSGTFSDDVLERADAVLWNAPIGEGAQKEPSSALLVLVEVAGPPDQSELRRVVEVSADYTTTDVDAKHRSVMRRVRVSEARAPGLFGTAGRAFVAILLNDTGCSPVRLRAQLAGKPATRIERAVMFHCGE